MNKYRLISIHITFCLVVWHFLSLALAELGFGLKIFNEIALLNVRERTLSFLKMLSCLNFLHKKINHWLYSFFMVVHFFLYMIETVNYNCETKNVKSLS